MERRDKAGGQQIPESAKRMLDAALLETIAQARAGKPEAWGEIYQHYAAAIFRFCRRVLPTREDAEDATMDIFLKIKGRLGQYDESRPFSAWLYKVASNHCLDLLRRRHIRQDLETGEVETLPLEHPDPGQLEQLMTAQSGKRVRDAMQQLPARSRMVLVLRYYADLSYDEIAEALDVRRAFVGVVLLRARVFAQVILVEGSVDQNLMAWVHTMEIASKGKVGGSVLGFAVSIISDGRIERDLTAEFSKNDLNGYIGGNATLSKGNLTIGPRAEIRGSASYKGEHRPEVSSQAKLASPLSIELQSRWDKYAHPHFYWWHLVRMVAALIFGLNLLFIAPDLFSRAVQKGDRIGASLGYGAVAMVATPVLAVVACITLVGIPVGVAGLLLFVVALYSTQIVVGAWLGAKLLGQPAGQGARIGRMALGLLIVRVTTLIPFVGVLAGCFVAFAGFGAITLAAHERFNRAAERAGAGTLA